MSKSTKNTTAKPSNRTMTISLVTYTVTPDYELIKTEENETVCEINDKDKNWKEFFRCITLKFYDGTECEVFTPKELQKAVEGHQRQHKKSS